MNVSWVALQRGKKEKEKKEEREKEKAGTER
jgi:hypothetical protein